VPEDSPLRDYVRAHAQNRPGVYRMIGRDHEVLYVGKSIRVRGRLLSYFRADRSDKASELIRETRQIVWEYVPNEFAALVREMKLIQRSQPEYNVQHRRKRRYAFVKITRERAPRVLPVTRVVEDGATYYGPFPAVGRVAQTVRELGQALELRDCPATTPVHFADQLDLWSPDRTPGCLRADLGTCLAPCCGRADAEAYRERVRQARDFLDGSGVEPVRRVDRAMREAAGRLDFEYAAILRERGDRLRRFREELLAFRGQVESLSFVYVVPGFEGDDRLYLIRRGTIREELPAPTTDLERAATAARVRQVFRQGDPGPAGLKAHEAAEILLVARWFRLRSEQRDATVKPRRWLREGGSPNVAEPSRSPTPAQPPAARRSARVEGRTRYRPGASTSRLPVAASTAPRE
jgi:excinuclease ABC subunit C